MADVIIEDTDDEKQICDFNLIRSGHLHTDDWNLVVLALESLVIDLEQSEGRMYGNMLERAEGLRHNIKHVILENNDD
jgi:hypothetical protein